jgi:hypothetical protein
MLLWKTSNHKMESHISFNYRKVITVPIKALKMCYVIFTYNYSYRFSTFVIKYVKY